MSFDEFLVNISTAVVRPALGLLFGITFIIFVWGVVQYIRNADDAKGRTEGQRSILWGLVGMMIMISVFGIIKIIVGTVGADLPTGSEKIDRQLKGGIENVEVTN